MNAWKIRRPPGLFTAMLCVILLGCASELVTPVIGYTPPLGEKAAETAISMIGMPYKFRGESPEGFDCSGLVRYSYRTAGLEVPHGTKALKVVTVSVSFQDISIGDLLFFNERGKKNSHV